MKNKNITIEEKYDAYLRAGSYRGAARELGLTESSVRNTINRYLAEKNIPDGQKLSGTSTLYDAEGNQRMQWIKTNADVEAQKLAIQEAIDAMRGEIKPEKPVKPPAVAANDLMSVYVVTDYHIGQLSWGDETGEDWNIEIAENMLYDWFSLAIKQGAEAHTAVLNVNGDFLHYDSLDSVTPTSKHVLDADARYQNMVRVGVRALRRIINELLKKHAHVHVIMAEGNHDISSSVWLRQLFADKYEDEPRVTVDQSHVPFYAYEWGKTSVFFHHGHKRSMAEISKTLAGMFRDIFGRTKYSYAHMGHLHHIHSKEDALMVVEQHPTMAAKDAHSARGGYVSNRGACVITYSKIHGEVSRITVRPEMLK